MGRFTPLVGSPADMEGFRAKYHIPQGVAYDTVLRIKCLPIGMRWRWSFP